MDKRGGVDGICHHGGVTGICMTFENGDIGGSSCLICLGNYK